MKIVRVLNNSVVLATRDDGGEVVLTGWGLGFGKKAGQPVDKSKVKQVFVPEHGRNVDNMGSLLASLDLDYVDLATNLVDGVAGALIPHPESATVIALADHIQMSIKRQGLADAHANDGHPLEAEVRHLYPDEYRVAERMLTETNAWLARRHQPPLPHPEATAITLHLVNAAFHTDDLSDTYTMTGLFSQLFDIVDSSLGITMDRKSVNAARFITHMRYFFVRVRNGNQLNEGMSILRDSLGQSHPDAVLCADRLASVLELRLDTELTDDERAYLALHVARLSAEIDHGEH